MAKAGNCLKLIFCVIINDDNNSPMEKKRASVQILLVPVLDEKSFSFQTAYLLFLNINMKKLFSGAALEI